MKGTVTEITAVASAPASVPSMESPSEADSDVAEIEHAESAQAVEIEPVQSVDDDAGLPAVHFFTRNVTVAAGDTRHKATGTVLAVINPANPIGYMSGVAVVGHPVPAGQIGTDTDEATKLMPLET
jgi:hypothetical protein